MNTLLSQLEQPRRPRSSIWPSCVSISGRRTESQEAATSNSESIQRNLQTALPTIISDLRNSPDSLTASFKLYRNLDALYDVFSSVAETTGAFGSKDEYQALGNDVSAIEERTPFLG